MRFALDTNALQPGQPTDPAGLNALYGDLNAPLLTGENLRDSGLDRWVFSANIGSNGQWRRVIGDAETTRTALSSTSWTNVVLGATTLQTAAFTLATDEAVLVKASIEFHTDHQVAPQYGIPAGETVDLRLVARTAAGSTLVLSGSNRTIGAFLRGRSLNSCPGHASVAITLWAENGGSALAAGAYDYLALQYKVSAGTFRARNGMIACRVLAKAG